MRCGFLKQQTQCAKGAQAAYNFGAYAGALAAAMPRIVLLRKLDANLPIDKRSNGNRYMRTQWQIG
jgi:hypothetical protein